MATRVRSFAKVNLGLRIGPVRPDGFHELATLYQTLALHDVVTVTARRAVESRIVVRTEHPWVPKDARNTAWQMVERALGAMGVTAAVEIEIEKRLPVQGGMGAGSANAAATLLGLERELGLEPGRPGALSGAERLRVAAEVGSDVPLFLVGGAVRGSGRGELVEAMPDVRISGGGRRDATFGDGEKFGDAKKLGEAEKLGEVERALAAEGERRGVPCVVAVPRLGVATPMAFREWDRLVREGGVFGLTSATEQSRLEELSLAYASAFAHTGGVDGQTKPDPSGIDLSQHPSGSPSREGRQVDQAESTLLALVRTGIENDFESVVFPFHPSLRSIKRLLMGEDSGRPAIYAALSGSGSALFGLYGTTEDARAAQQRVQASGTESLLTETLPRPEYWARMYDGGR